MANAWIIKPLAPVASSTIGTLQIGVAANVFNDYAGIICQLGLVDGSASFRFDLGQDISFDTVAVFGVDRIGANGSVVIYTATAAQGNFTGDSTAQPLTTAYAGSSRPSDVGMTLWSSATPVTARYVQVTYQSAGGGVVRAARIVIGRRIEPDRNFSFGAGFGVRDLGSVDFSRFGVMLRKRGRKLRTLALTFASIFKDEVEASVQPLLEEVGNTEPVALITDPAPHAMRDRRMYFGPLVGDLGTVLRKANTYQAQISLVSLF